MDSNHLTLYSVYNNKDILHINFETEITTWNGTSTYFN